MGFNTPGFFEAVLTLIAAAWLNDYIRRHNSRKEFEKNLFSAFLAELKYNQKKLSHNDNMINFGLDSPLVRLSNRHLDAVKLNPPKKLKIKKIKKQIINLSENIDDINYAMGLRENLWIFRDKSPKHKDYINQVEGTLKRHIKFLYEASYELERELETQDKSFLSEMLRFWVKYFGLDSIIYRKEIDDDDMKSKLMREARIINQRLRNYPVQQRWDDESESPNKGHQDQTQV